MSIEAIQRDDDGLWMDGVIVKSNNTDHNGQSYKVSVMKIRRLITCNTKHMWRTTIKTKQYFREQIGDLEDILTNINLIRQERTFNPYMACTQVNMN